MSHLPLPKSPTSAWGPAESPREPSERDEADQYPIPLHSPQETGWAHSPQLETSCSLTSSQGCPGCSSTCWPSTRPHQEGTEESPGTPHISHCPEHPGDAGGGLSPATSPADTEQPPVGPFGAWDGRIQRKTPSS